MRLNPEYFGDSSSDDSSESEDPKIKAFKFLEELPPQTLEFIAGHKLALQDVIEHQKENGDGDPLLTIIAMQGHQLRLAQKALIKMRKVLVALVKNSNNTSDEDLNLPF